MPAGDGHRAVGRPWVTAVTVSVWLDSLAGPVLSLASGSMVDRAVLGHGRPCRRPRRRVVDLGDRDVDRGRVGLGIGDAVGGAVVGDRVGEAVGAVVVGGRRVGDAAARSKRHACRWRPGSTAVTVSVWPTRWPDPCVVGQRGRWSTELSSATVAVSSTAVGRVVDLGDGDVDGGRVAVPPLPSLIV